MEVIFKKYVKTQEGTTVKVSVNYRKRTRCGVYGASFQPLDGYRYDGPFTIEEFDPHRAINDPYLHVVPNKRGAKRDRYAIKRAERMIPRILKQLGLTEHQAHTGQIPAGVGDSINKR